MSLRIIRAAEALVQTRDPPSLQACDRIHKTPPGVAFAGPIAGAILSGPRATQAQAEINHKTPQVAQPGQKPATNEVQATHEARARARKLQEQNLQVLNIQKKRKADSWSPAREAPGPPTYSRGHTFPMIVPLAKPCRPRGETRTRSWQATPSAPTLLKDPISPNVPSWGQSAAQSIPRLAQNSPQHEVQAYPTTDHDFSVAKGNAIIVPRGLSVNIDATGVHVQNTSKISFASIEHAAEYFRAQARLCEQRAIQAMHQAPPGWGNAPYQPPVKMPPPPCGSIAHQHVTEFLSPTDRRRHDATIARMGAVDAVAQSKGQMSQDSPSSSIACSEGPPQILFDEPTPQVQRLLSDIQVLLPERHRLDWHRSPPPPSPVRQTTNSCHLPLSPLRQTLDSYRPTPSEDGSSRHNGLRTVDSRSSYSLDCGDAPNDDISPAASALFGSLQALEKEDRRILGVSSTAGVDEYGFYPHPSFSLGGSC